MLVEHSEWGLSIYQFCACVLAVLSPEAATHNKNKYRGTQRNDSRQFCKAAYLVRTCVVGKRVAVFHFSYDRFQPRYRGDGVHVVE